MAEHPRGLRAVGRCLSPSEWWKVGGMAATIVALNVIGWGIFILAVLPTHDHSKGVALGVGVAVTAYTLGMRHAFDADHISAIDNTTRKFMAEGKRPLSVGFWFLPRSLDHRLRRRRRPDIGRQVGVPSVKPARLAPARLRWHLRHRGSRASSST